VRLAEAPVDVLEEDAGIDVATQERPNVIVERLLVFAELPP
jgi:hypothetical protein